MAPQNPPYAIVVGIDFDEDGDVALGSALRIAAGVGNSVVHVLNVDPSLDTFDSGSEHDSRVGEVLGAMEKICNEQLAVLKVDFPLIDRARLVTHCGGGDPALQLVQLAASLDADLIVVGSRGRRGLKRWVLGSVAERVVRLAGCTVVVARARNHGGDAEVAIEPPCPECVKMRALSNGAELWCKRHQGAKYHPAAHRYVGGGPPNSPGRPFGATVP